MNYSGSLVVQLCIVFVLLINITISLQSCTDFIGILSEPLKLNEISCTHHCNEKGSCTNDIINCYPQSSCSIRCSGDESCHNLTIQSEDMVDLQV